MVVILDGQLDSFALNGTCGGSNCCSLFVDIMIVTLDGHLDSIALNRSIHRFQHAHNVQALEATTDRALLGSHALKKMTALLL
jgi:hypothetical protein